MQKTRNSKNPIFSRSRLRLLLLICTVLMVPVILCSGKKAEKASKEPALMGIDISAHNGDIDWKTVKRYNKFAFVYIKASEGATHVDKRYSDNIKGARKAGYKVGSYHYFRMTSSAHAQYRNFLKQIGRNRQDLIPMIDVETTDGRPVKEVRDSLNVLISLLRGHFGKSPMIYSSIHHYNTICGEAYDKYHLYIGRYSKEPPVIHGKGTYTIWQYSETGKIKGIPMPVDLARFNKKYTVKSIRL